MFLFVFKTVEFVLKDNGEMYGFTGDVSVSEQQGKRPGVLLPVSEKSLTWSWAGVRVPVSHMISAHTRDIWSHCQNCLLFAH